MSAPVLPCPPAPSSPGLPVSPASPDLPPFAGLPLLPGIPLLPGQPSHHADLVVVDVETTGWLADDAGITEIGAVRLSPGQPMAEFTTLVNPGVPIPPDITTLTGITNAMVSDAPPIGDVLPRFLEFALGSVLVAHNAPFDVGFLTAACHGCGLRWPPTAIIDTATLARMVLLSDEVPDHKLATLSDHFATRTGPCHRALADAMATAGVLAGLLALLASPLPRAPDCRVPEIGR